MYLCHDDLRFGFCWLYKLIDCSSRLVHPSIGALWMTRALAVQLHTHAADLCADWRVCWAQAVVGSASPEPRTLLRQLTQQQDIPQLPCCALHIWQIVQSAADPTQNTLHYCEATLYYCCVATTLHTMKPIV